jgi:hypothetical protein
MIVVARTSNIFKRQTHHHIREDCNSKCSVEKKKLVMGLKGLDAKTN